MTNDNPIFADLRAQWDAADNGEEQKSVLADAAARLPDTIPAEILPREWNPGANPEDIARVVLEEPDDAQAIEIIKTATHEPGDAPVRRNWEGKAPDRYWLIDGWLPLRIAMLTGRGGTGKSRLTLQLAAAIAGGDRKWLTGAPDLNISEAETAIIASWEDEDDELHRRLAPKRHDQTRWPDKYVGDRLHYIDEAGLGPLWEPDPDGSRHTSTQGTWSASGRWLLAYAAHHKARLLVVDPTAAAYGLDENSRALVRGYMTALDRWARDHQCTVLMVAHPPKNSTESYSGSTDWWSASRAVWNLGLEDTGTGDPMDPSNPEGKRKPALAPRLLCEKSSYNSGKLPKHLWLKSAFREWEVTSATAAAKSWEEGNPDIADDFVHDDDPNGDTLEENPFG